MSKQIEEMAKVLSTVKRCDTLAVSECIKKKCEYPHYDGVTCIAEHQAQALYKAGYRKASEVAREIFTDIAKITSLTHGWNEPTIYAKIDFEELKELKKKYTEGGE